MQKLIKSGDIVTAKKISNIFRYLDDLLGLNDEDFFRRASNTIYPPELNLSCTDRDGKQADYLDMYIDFHN